VCDLPVATPSRSSSIHTRQVNLIEILPSEARLQALTVTNMGGTPDNFRSFLTAKFDRVPLDYGTWTDSTVHPGQTQSEGEHSGAWVRQNADRRGRRCHLTAPDC